MRGRPALNDKPGEGVECPERFTRPDQGPCSNGASGQQVDVADADAREAGGLGGRLSLKGIRRLLPRLPQARIQVFEESGHDSFEPERSAQVVGDFLA